MTIDHPWQPIETARKDGTSVWVLGWWHAARVTGRWFARARWSDLLGAWVQDELSEQGEEELAPPTHWMPLPDTRA